RNMAPLALPTVECYYGLIHRGAEGAHSSRRFGGTMAQTATATKLRPLGDRVVVRPAAREETTRSGIVLPDTSTERPQRGAILAVGPGRVTDEGRKVPMEVKAGDAVLFAKYAGT